jgi:hypothetical protein
VTYPNQICAECGLDYGTYIYKLSCWSIGICGWCGVEKPVTEPRDFGYPPHPPEPKPRKRARGSRLGEQADMRGGDAYHAHLKKSKARFERRKAKLDPTTPPTYGKYRGYES